MQGQIFRNKRINFILGICFSIAICIVQFQASMSIADSCYEVAGCDPFGYARQARLFRQADHPLDGFNTDLKDASYQDLKSWAQSTEMNPQGWYQMVAPHCHHYRPTSEKLIIQYPFGTGWLMSLLPEEHERRWLAIGSLSIGAVLGIFKINREKSPLLKIFRTFNTLTLIYLIQIFWLRSDSLAPSILIAYWSAEMALAYAKNPQTRSQWLSIVSILLGLLLGFSITIRTGNLFFWFAGFLAIGLVALAKPFQKQPLTRTIGWGTLGLLPGTLANLYFNAVNTGSAFVTTYTPKDTKLTNNLETILSNYSKITNEDGCILLLICAGLFVITFIKLMAKGWPSIHDRSFLKLSAIVFTGWGSLILLLLLTTAKVVFLPYYLLCQVVFTSTLICCSDVSPEGFTDVRQDSHHKSHVPWSNHIRTVAMTLSSIVIMVQTLSQSNITQPTDNPLPDIDRNNSIVWADNGTGSYFYYYHGLPTGKLIFGNAKSQNQIINDLQEQGIDQYFVDADNILDRVHLLRPQSQFEQVGKFRDQDIYKLK